VKTSEVRRNDYVSALDGARLTKIDPGLEPLPTFLNALGIPA
jgi:hypothetical protein